ILEQGARVRLSRHVAHLIDLGINAGRSGLLHALKRSEEPDVPGPIEWSVGTGVGNWMAREAGLRICLCRHVAREHVGHRALARTRSAENDHMKRSRRLVIQKWTNHVTAQGRRQPKLPRLHALLGPSTAMLLQPRKVVGQLLGELADAEAIRS